jgi:hypothetical protein
MNKFPKKFHKLNRQHQKETFLTELKQNLRKQGGLALQKNLIRSKQINKYPQRSMIT